MPRMRRWANSGRLQALEIAGEAATKELAVKEEELKTTREAAAKELTAKNQEL